MYSTDKYGNRVYTDQVVVQFDRDGSYAGTISSDYAYPHGPYVNHAAGGISIEYLDTIYSHLLMNLLPLEWNEFWVMGQPRGAQHDPSLVSYYENAEKMKAGRRTVVKPGRYIRKIIPADLLSDRWDDQDIEKFANAWISAHKSRELHLLTDPDDIENAYIGRAFGSCMGHFDTAYASCEHPVRVYGSTNAVKSDLAVAVIYEDAADKGEWESIAGRVVVWPEKKVWGRIYGDVHKTKAALVAAGYQKGGFDGARIRRIEDRYGSIVCPYLDIADTVAVASDHLIIDGGEYSCHNTNGLLEGGYSCDGCSSNLTEDDMRYGPCGDGCYCHECWHEHFFYDEVDGEDYYISDQVVVHGRVRYRYINDTVTVSQSGADTLLSAGSIFYCEYGEEYYSTSEYDYVVTDEGNTYESGVFFKHVGYQCMYSEEYYEDSYEHTLAHRNGAECKVSSYMTEDDTDYVQWCIDNGWEDDRFPETALQKELAV